VPDRQLSLAIGKGGQNARLAARLTGWRIDIKSTSMVEGAAPPKTEEAPRVGEAAPEEAVGLAEPEAVEAAAETAEAAEPAGAAEAVAAAEEKEPQSIVEEVKLAPAPGEAKPARRGKPEEAAEPQEEAAPRTLTFEEILSQLEAIPERRGRQPRYAPEEKMSIVIDTKPKKGKKAGAPDEEPGVKPKVKKVSKRRVTIDDEDVDDDIVEDEKLEEGE
jgi:hypothetical protein